MLLTLWIAFGLSATDQLHLFYPLFVPVIWIALRWGLAGSMLATLVIQIGLIVGAQEESNAPPFLVLQFLMLTLSLTALLLGAVFASADDFLEVYDPEWRGCLLTDLQMPGTGGLELQSILRQRDVALPVVVLTAHGDVVNTRLALKNGAVDFLKKPVDDAVLIDVLQNAIRIDAERHQIRAERHNIAQRLERLTPREREVLELLAKGSQHREIAEQLSISPRTVEVYKSRMMEKLQCRTLADVIRIGSETRLTGSER